MTSPRYSLLIIGGCVSRDTVDPLLGESLELKRYVARQSFISAGTDATKLVPKVDLRSQFQRRMLEADLSGSLFRDVEENSEVDLVLWDLNVERLGAWQFDVDTFVTDSGEFRRMENYSSITTGVPHIDFGEEDHFRIWKERFFQFKEVLQRNGLVEKTLLLAPDWALVDETGETVGLFEAVKAGAYNAIYRRYWDFAEANGFEVLRMQDTVAESHHKWGPAPFHYTEGVYDVFRETIMGKLA